MNRRDVLSILWIVGTGGCLSVPSTSSSPIQKTGPANSVSLKSKDKVPKEYGIETDVTIVQSEYTDERPAEIRITLTNTAQKRRISVGPDMCFLFNRSRGGSDDPPGLWLHGRDEATYINRDGEKWVADKSPDQPRGSANYGCGMETYNEEESVSKILQIWDDYRVDGYLTPGVYRWEEHISIEDGPSSDNNSTESITWGFSISLS